jgi:hypothetical protein
MSELEPLGIQLTERIYLDTIGYFFHVDKKGKFCFYFDLMDSDKCKFCGFKFSNKDKFIMNLAKFNE